MATTRAALAQLYSSLTGLDYQVALGQLNAENSKVGRGTNPLGVRCGNSKGSGLEIGCDRSGFAIYRSSGDGIRAAAWLLLHGSHYGAVRQAIKTGTPASQRLALIRSGWAAGGYSGGAGFPTAGISGSAPATVGPPPVLSRQPSARLANSPTAAVAAGGGLVWGVPDGKILTSADVETILSAMVAARVLPDMGSSIGLPFQATNTVRGILRAEIGRPWNTATRERVQAKLGIEAKAQPTDLGGALGAIGGALPVGDLFAWVPGTIANVAVLATVLALGYLGVRKLLG